MGRAAVGVVFVVLALAAAGGAGAALKKQFVANFKAYCKSHNLPGGDTRVVDDPIEAAYYGVYVWAAAATKASAMSTYHIHV